LNWAVPEGRNAAEAEDGVRGAGYALNDRFGTTA
jgi:hypothetical protein